MSFELKLRRLIADERPGDSFTDVISEIESMLNPLGKVVDTDTLEPTTEVLEGLNKAGRTNLLPTKAKLPRTDTGRYVYPDAFSEALKAYPKASRRPTPGPCYASWRAEVVAGVSPVAILQGIKNFAQSVFGREAQFIKGGDNFFRNKMWEDFYDNEENSYADFVTIEESPYYKILRIVFKAGVNPAPSVREDLVAAAEQLKAWNVDVNSVQRIHNTLVRQFPFKFGPAALIKHWPNQHRISKEAFCLEKCGTCEREFDSSIDHPAPLCSSIGGGMLEGCTMLSLVPRRYRDAYEKRFEKV